MNDDLTPTNYVEKIKAMGDRERSKITLKKLIELIIQVPEPVPVSSQLVELKATMEHLTQMVSRNQTEILTLKTANEGHTKTNLNLRLEIDLLKEHAQECKQNRRQQPIAPEQQQPLQQSPEIKDIRTEITTIQTEINSIQQYLRVNNLEIVGLPEPNHGETEEKLLINAINELEGLAEIVRPEDIDISHPLNSNRKDGKTVHVVRFISRKTKGMILAAKKLEANKQFKFRNKDVYINEHLSKGNRALFAAAQDKKRTLNYKFCWTRGGTIHMRKTDDSPVVTISAPEDLTNLV